MVSGTKSGISFVKNRSAMTPEMKTAVIAQILVEPNRFLYVTLVTCLEFMELLHV